MPSLLYCITRPNPAVSISTGVCDVSVQSRELLGVRLYWSEIDDPAVRLAQPQSLKQAALQFHKVLHEVLAVTTPIPFRFPTLLESEDAFEKTLTAEQEMYSEALNRVDNALQYEVVGTWADDQRADLSKPVSGREYLKRRQEAAGRIAAVDTKLKSVTGDSVLEWRTRQDRKTRRWFALVPRENRERFLTSLRTAGGSEGVRLRLSGPWPPSEFVIHRGERG